MDNDYPNYPNPVRLSFLEGISMENSSYMTEKYKKKSFRYPITSID